MCPRKTRRSQRNGHALSSPSPASAAPSPVSSAPPSGARSSQRVLCCLDRRPFRAVCSQPPGHPGARLAVQRGPRCRAELPSRAPRQVFWVLTAGLLVSSASPSAAAVFLKYIGAASLPQSRQRLLRWPRDSAGPGPLPSAPRQASVAALPSSRASWPFLPPRMRHRACAGLCPRGLPPRPPCFFQVSVHLRLSCVPRLGSLLTRHLTLRALLAPPVRTRACGSRAVAGQHWPAELLGSYLSEWPQRGLSKPKAGTPASLHLD